MPPLVLGLVYTHLLTLSPWVASSTFPQIYTGFSRYIDFSLLHIILNLCPHTAFHSLLLISRYFMGIMHTSLPLWWEESGLDQPSRNVCRLVLPNTCPRAEHTFSMYLTNNSICCLIFLLIFPYKYMQISLSLNLTAVLYSCICTWLATKVWHIFPMSKYGTFMCLGNIQKCISQCNQTWSSDYFRWVSRIHEEMLFNNIITGGCTVL